MDILSFFRIVNVIVSHLADVGAVATVVTGVHHTHALHRPRSAGTQPVPAPSRRRRPGRLSIVALAAIAAVAIGAAALFHPRVEQWLFDRAAETLTARANTAPLEDDALRVAICGSSAPLPSANRAKACVAVFAGGKFYLVDVGPESVENLVTWGIPLASIGGVLLTHFHSDHIGELGEATLQSWVAGRGKPLAVFGAPGVDYVVEGFRQAYAFDTQYRIAHHGEEAMPPLGSRAVAKTVDLPRPGEAAVVFEADGLRVTAFAVDHAPVTPAYGYRFDYRGRSVVISGDTKKSENLIRHAQGADLLVHEALAANMIAPVTEYARAQGLSRFAKLTSDVVTYHTTPAQAAEVAKAANVRMLALTHVVPPLPNFIARRMFLRGVSEAWSGEVVLGKDGMHFTLPRESTAIPVDTLE